jgi:predicted DCC family thiol-disulfide oxidoreductase YuxK
MTSAADSILVFDGVCVLCSHWVRFVLRYDRARRFKFAAMQTTVGRDLLLRHGLDPDDPKSFLLFENGRGYTDTDAIARVLEAFGGGWRALAIAMRVVPRFVRDAIYRFIARHRYTMFGRHAVCTVPGADVADRFL